MNENTFSVFSTYSPIVEHPGTGLWTLRAVHVDPAAVEAVRAENALRPRQKKIVDYGWDFQRVFVDGNAAVRTV